MEQRLSEVKTLAQGQTVGVLHPMEAPVMLAKRSSSLCSPAYPLLSISFAIEFFFVLAGNRISRIFLVF